MEPLETLAASVDGLLWEAEAHSFKLTSVSPQIERLFGYPAQAWLRDPAFWRNQIFHEDRALAVRRYQEGAARGGTFSVSYRFVTASQRLARIHDRVTLVAGERRPPVLRGIMIEADLSDQAQAASERTAHLRHALEGLRAGIVLEDETGRIILVNKEIWRLFGIPPMPEALVGVDSLRAARTSQGWFAEPERVVPRVAEILMRREVVEGEELRLADGRTIERDYIPLFIEGSYRGHLWQYRDITLRKQAEREIIRAREEAEMAALARSRFLTTVSHELRTPMNGVIGMTSLLLATPLGAEQRRFAETIAASANALLAVLNEILDFSDIEAGTVKVEAVPFDLWKLAADTCEHLMNQAQQKGLRLHVHVDPEVPVRVVGDPARLRQVLAILIGNAVKFTEAGEIELRLRPARSGRSAAVCFAVRDTGIGIPREGRERIFRSFSQYDSSSTRRYGGTGLGLAICKSLLELMGSSIKVESEPGAGSTFFFTLPLGPAS